MSNKIIATIERDNGDIETVDLSDRFCGMTENLFRKIKDANKRNGRGDVLKIEHTYTVSNYAELEREYINGMLEGGEGYIPDMTKDPRFRTWEETKVFAA